MRAEKRVTCFILLLTAVFAPHAKAQKIEVATVEDRPYSLDPDPSSDSGDTRGLFSSKSSAPKASPARFTSMFMLASPGPYGTFMSLQAMNQQGPIGMAGVDQAGIDQALLSELMFPSINFTFSAAARIITGEPADSDDKVEGKLKSFTELKQLGVNVKIAALDKDKKVMGEVPDGRFAVEFGPDPVVALTTFPSDSVYVQQSSTAAKIAEGVGGMSSFMGPVGGLATGICSVFRAFFPVKDVPTQVAFQSSFTEFGWIWRDFQGGGIEGVHKCLVLLRAHTSVKYIRVEMEMVTDWKRFGGWLRKIDYVIPVGRRD